MYRLRLISVSVCVFLIILTNVPLLSGYTIMQRQSFWVKSNNDRLVDKSKIQQLYASTIDSDKETETPFAVIVQAEIVPDRMEEFLQLIENNAIQSRQEEQCLRFDVVQSQDQDNKFFFYEIYTNNHSAMDYHKSQSHYMAWANFKESGGTISSVTYKANGLFLPE